MGQDRSRSPGKQSRTRHEPQNGLCPVRAVSSKAWLLRKLSRRRLNPIAKSGGDRLRLSCRPGMNTTAIPASAKLGISRAYVKFPVMTSKAPVQQQRQRRCPCPLEQLIGYLPLIHGGRDRRRPRSVRRAPRPWAASQPRPATRFPGPCGRCAPAGRRRRLLRGSAVVSTGSWATRCRRSRASGPSG
jgi:hypothetical protein